MNINQIEWYCYTDEPSYLEEIEYLEWHTDPEGRFCMYDVRQIYKSLSFSYAKLLVHYLQISFNEATNIMYNKNADSFERKLQETFKDIPFGAGIGYSRFYEIFATMYVPKIP